jgi:4-diphosphocytidyl-2-C-methyl-D-erythritol kinase
MRTGDTAAIAAAAGNDLEHALLQKFPLLRLLAASLRKAGADAVHVSGSGPTLFALCPFSARSEIATRMRTEYGTAIRIRETRVAAGTATGEQPGQNTGPSQKI